MLSNFRILQNWVFVFENLMRMRELDRFDCRSQTVHWLVLEASLYFHEQIARAEKHSVLVEFCSLWTSLNFCMDTVYYKYLKREPCSELICYFDLKIKCEKQKLCHKVTKWNEKNNNNRTSNCRSDRVKFKLSSSDKLKSNEN